MTAQWLVRTNGDPLGAVRLLLRRVWEQLRLHGMLAMPDGAFATGTAGLLTDPLRLAEVNPFTPLMVTNSAALIPDLLSSHAGERLAAVLRPCELRVLVEMAKHDGFALEELFTITVDCLATLSIEEYRWRARRHGSSGAVTDEALQYARLGGIVPYRYRAACQICPAQAAQGADLNIGVLGLPVRESILVTVQDETTARRVRLDSLGDAAPAESLLRERDHSLQRLTERRSRTRERISHGLAESLPSGPSAIAALLERCCDCGTCLTVCPIDVVDPVRPAGDGKYLTRDVARRLISCSGCGVCEDACPSHLPLTAMFCHVRDGLSASTGYQPGRSVREPVPIA